VRIPRRIVIQGHDPVHVSLLPFEMVSELFCVHQPPNRTPVSAVRNSLARSHDRLQRDGRL
jgi:hypothetical protein